MVQLKHKLLGPVIVASLAIVGLVAAPLQAFAVTAQLTPLGSALSSWTGTADDGYVTKSITSVFPSGVKFGDNSYTSVHVGTNGYITFGQGQTGYRPTGIQAYTLSAPIIAAQYDDLDPRKGGSVYFYEDVANNRVVMTWDAVRAYDSSVGAGSDSAGTSFQIVLTKPGSYDASHLDFGIEIRYQDIGWAKSGNNSAFPSAGWSTGTTNPVYQELPRSGSDSFIDTENESNVGEAGVYRWAVTNGVIPSPPTVQTVAASGIGAASATLGGEIKSDGESDLAARGIVLSTSPLPTDAKDAAGVTTLTEGGSDQGAFSVTASGLSASTKYYFRAWAENATGVGYGRELSFDTLAISAPSAPQSFAITPGDSQVGLSFTAPTSDGGSAITAYQYSLDGAAWVGLGASPGSFSISSLTNGTQYRLKLRANNSAQYGTPTSELTFVAGAPSAPTLSSVSAGNGKLTVAFSPPLSNGGFSITDYEYSTDNGSTWTSAGTTASPITISGLTNGTPYQVKLRGKGNFSGVASSASTGTPAATVPDAPTITSVAATAGTLTVRFTAPVDNGGAVISNYKWSTDGTNYRDLSPTQTTSPIVLTTLSSDGTTVLVDGTAYPITLKAVNSNGDSAASNSVSGTPGVVRSSSTSTSTRTEPVVVPPVAVPAVPPRVTTPPGTAVPAVQSGPVLTRGVVPAPPKAPTVVLGGKPTLMSVTVPSTTQLDVKAGRLSLGVKVLEDQGTISEAPDGTTQIAVKKGASATISGSGFKPAATVQVFLPLDGDNAKELTRIPVAADGSFDGSAPFATRANEAPLPVGKQVLQLVSLDNDGNQVVVEMTVNIAQGAPAPEANRVEGVIPAMQPGQSIATSGGEPVPVTITPVSDQKLAVVEGDGWTMAVNVNSDQGGVEPAEGGALLKLVRNESALVSGSGFMAGTRADVWLFSDPTLLGTVTIDENGEFTGEVNIDPNMIPVGQHTLQLQGVGEDGYVKAANMGVLVDDPAEAVTDTATASLTFLWWIIAAVLVVLVLGVILASRRRRVT